MNANSIPGSNDPIRLDARFQRGVELFNAAAWYEAHDVLEELWHETADPHRRVLQGLIQVAVAHVHLERGNRKGATILLGEGLGRLTGRDLPDFGLDLPQLRARVAARLHALQQGDDPASCPVPVLVDRP
ncbi:MAG: DUF309 domain-containing protein [Synechococcus sp.]